MIFQTRSFDLTEFIVRNISGLYDLRLQRIRKPEFVTKTIENRIYREEFTGKKCKTAILLYCFHTAGVLHIFMLYRKSKIIIKRKPNYKIGWFHN